MKASLLHVTEVTTNFPKTVTNEVTASANDRTQLLREYGIVKKTSGGRKLKHGTGDIISNIIGL